MRLAYLTSKRNYNPLKKWFYVMPFYASHPDETPPIHYFLRILGSIILLKVGYEFGTYETRD
jgi:hypothetical protein